MGFPPQYDPGEVQILTPPKSILVIQLRRIGDVLMATPAVAALKASFPEAAIDFLAEPPCDEILEGNPHIRRIHAYCSAGLGDYLSWIGRIRACGYDWVVDLMGNPRSAMLTACSGAAVRAGPAHVGHRWAYNHPLVQSTTTQYAGLEKMRVLRTLGVAETGSLPRLHIPGLSRGTGNTVGLVPASRKPTRQWPAASYARLGRLLREKHGCDIIVFWGPGEKPLAQEVVSGIGEGAALSPETKDLRSLASLIAGCRLLVTNCNGPKHIAVALDVPTVTIHGSSDPVSWTPKHPKHAAVREEQLHCIGCGKNVCPYKLECMTQLTPERVLEAASRLLGAEALA